MWQARQLWSTPWTLFRARTTITTGRQLWSRSTTRVRTHLATSMSRLGPTNSTTTRWVARCGDRRGRHAMMTQPWKSPFRLMAVVVVALLLMATTALAVRAAAVMPSPGGRLAAAGKQARRQIIHSPGTMGQSDAHGVPATGGDYAVSGGFWHNPAAPPAGDLRVFLPTVKTTQ